MHATPSENNIADERWNQSSGRVVNTDLAKFLTLVPFPDGTKFQNAPGTKRAHTELMRGKVDVRSWPVNPVARSLGHNS